MKNRKGILVQPIQKSNKAIFRETTDFVYQTYKEKRTVFRGGSRTAGTSKMERFVIIVNSWKPLTIITKRSILDVVAVLDPPLVLA